VFNHARSVRLEEFQGFIHPQVLTSVELTGNDVGDALVAMPYVPDLGGPGFYTMCSFTPHHRIRVVMENGETMDVAICFTCDALSLRPGGDRRHAPIVAMPYVWRPLLRRLFTSHGIAGHTHYEDFDP